MLVVLIRWKDSSEPVTGMRRDTSAQANFHLSVGLEVGLAPEKVSTWPPSHFEGALSAVIVWDAPRPGCAPTQVSVRQAYALGSCQRQGRAGSPGEKRKTQPTPGGEGSVHLPPLHPGRAS